MSMFRDTARSEVIKVCLECGAGVASEAIAIHQRWHSQLRRIEREAQDAMLKVRRATGLR